ncbi:TPA: hypothetical protein ACM4JR_003420 [Escherichia coli]|uniref:Putative transcriptional regulators n=1 Tax=Escherichia coli TaxID=562 RepID=A0A7G9A8K8_ECOLX|nr:hypothetical protein [Escherichia coli]QNL33087.1 putative transcriptional regulators [Escherichia coli]
MSVLLTEPTQQANDKVFKTAHVAFSVVTGTGRYVTGLKQFRDANPELCTEVSDQKAWAGYPPFSNSGHARLQLPRNGNG